MNDRAEADHERRRGPDGSAWADAQRSVADRNEQARKAGKRRREEHERRLAALRRAAREKQ
jgi:hypothetical protein